MQSPYQFNVNSFVQMSHRLLLCALLLLATISCSTNQQAKLNNTDALRVILVGDSTMATRTGYGDALCRLFDANVTCINLARGGRSSGSFRAEGLWDQMMASLAADSGFAATYVLIQFGHNDQPGKPGRSTDLVTEFPVNMARYVDEVKKGGAIPVLVTPLTRRIFRDGKLHNDLVPWADATRRLAETQRVALIDLNSISAAAVSAMGSAEADTLAEEPPPPKPLAPVSNAQAEPNGAPKSRFDYTHLGAKGAALFAGMVVRDLAAVAPDLSKRLKSGEVAK
jgi:lysophospholipase L1-like esterase